jgi:hypothetical protein
MALSWVDGYKPIGEVHVQPLCESLTCTQQGLHADQCHVEYILKLSMLRSRLGAR